VSPGAQAPRPGDADDDDGDDARDASDPPRQRLLLHAGLFLATILTTTATGALAAHRGEAIAPIRDGLPYSLPLMLILLCHELGHYIVARLHGVPASLPYFIPLPPGFGFGTLGAVIGMRRGTTDRKQLIDVGAAGPLAGLAVAIPLLVYGLMHSKVGPLSNGTLEGNSILYATIKWIVKGAWLPNSQNDVFLHPTARAAWVGLLITMINLLPIGQLDGGHVATAYFGNRYNRFAERLRRLLPVGAIAVFFWVLHASQREAGSAWRLQPGVLIGVYAALPWLIWFFLVGLMRRMTGGVNHPPVDDKPLPRSRRALFWLMVVVFVGVFMPVPIRPILVGPPDAPAEPPISASLGP
jgi:membrane-associated protease RseP (regulator of RpoE activity)